MYAWHSRRPTRAPQPSAAEPHAAPRGAHQAVEYAALMQRRRKEPGCCPPLLLAPMEGLADAPFRKALVAAAGGFDEATTEFIRVPNAASHPRKMVRGVTARWVGLMAGGRADALLLLVPRPVHGTPIPAAPPQPLPPPPLPCPRSYDCNELGAVPLAAQVMGANKELLAATASRLVHALGAPRLDLNCGCPANTVTGAPGHGARRARRRLLLRGRRQARPARAARGPTPPARLPFTPARLPFAPPGRRQDGRLIAAQGPQRGIRCGVCAGARGGRRGAGDRQDAQV